MNDKTWIKRKTTGANPFDVPMGSFDGAEVCELVGLYILNEISDVLDKNDVGLYRDDGLAVIRSTKPSERERIKKRLCSKFTTEFNLKITADANLNEVDYLDITLNLKQNSFKPFRKPDDDPVYINVKSNHPPMIFKQLPNSINVRISTLSDSEESFNNATPPYKKALSESGYSHDFTFENKSKKSDKKKRKRKIIWFNPPYSRNVTTNIGKEFFKLLDRHFPKGSPLSKIFNRNTVKLSYSCMENMNNIISTHNKHILNSHTVNTDERKCSCPKKSKTVCPLDGYCLASNIVYKATVTAESSPLKQYIGLTGTTFKQRLANHTQSFNNKTMSNASELSKHIWHLKNKGESYNLKWSIIQRAAPYNPATKRCNLCLAEKFHIMTAPKDRTLNKRSELVSNCRHKHKYKLKEFDIT